MPDISLANDSAENLCYKIFDGNGCMCIFTLQKNLKTVNFLMTLCGLLEANSLNVCDSKLLL